MLEYIKAWLNSFFNAVSSDTVTDFEEKTTPWTEEEVESLKQLTESGLTYGEIAMILNRTESAVYQKYRRLLKKEEK